MLTFGNYESMYLGTTGDIFETSYSPTAAKFIAEPDSVKIIDDKVCIPQTLSSIERPRLLRYLEKSLLQFSATVITGRAGTGKTTLTADFARQSGYDVAWYKVETADSSWKVFLSYIAGSLNRLDSKSLDLIEHINQSTESDIGQMTDIFASWLIEIGEKKPLLLVLDDLHSVFDADWFTEFFNNLVKTPMPNVHLLATSRVGMSSWRLRSKQFLGVMEEKLLAFTLEEAIQLFKKYGLGAKAAREDHKSTFGNIAKLKQIAQDKSLNSK
jgi:ATP/maltotriose-dependent transcriptional regulator MalT